MANMNISNLSRTCLRKLLALSLLVSLSIATTGCFGPPDLPAELEVVLPDDVRQAAPINSGPESFANGVWQARRAPIDDSVETPAMSPYGGLLTGGLLERVAVDALMFRGHFDEAGVATGVTDNHYYLPNLLGDELPIDNQFHGTRVPGLTFAAASYGAQVDDQVGFAIPAEVRLFGIQVSKVIVYAWGTLDETETRVDGIFGYTSDLNLIPELILGSGGDQYPFYAAREPSQGE